MYIYSVYTFVYLVEHRFQRREDIDKKGDFVVALFAERSLEMVVSALGILKASAAYLPVDSAIPVARARYMIMSRSPSSEWLFDGFALAIVNWHASPL